MLQNLFSVLSEEQLNSLTKEERQTLAKRVKSDVEKVMERRKKEAETDAEYRQFMESSFI